MKIMINNGNLSNIFSIRDKTRQTGNVICLSIHNIFIVFPISNHTLLYEFPHRIAYKKCYGNILRRFT